ncbi:MAG: hypothetical protein AAFY08_02680 [Planctomycetota bacterium]
MTAPRPDHDPAARNAGDPELDALLDQTLGQDDVPAYLADRIVEATLPELRRSAGPTPVLARIGPSLKIALRVAAVVLVGAVVALALINAPADDATDDTDLANATETTPPMVTDPEPQPQPSEVALAEALAPLDRLDAALAEAAPRQDALDAELDLLAMRVELASVERSWTDAESLLDASLTTMELEQTDGLSSMTF